MSDPTVLPGKAPQRTPQEAHRFPECGDMWQVRRSDVDRFVVVDSARPNSKQGHLIAWNHGSTVIMNKYWDVDQYTFLGNVEQGELPNEGWARWAIGLIRGQSPNARYTVQERVAPIDVQPELDRWAVAREIREWGTINLLATGAVGVCLLWFIEQHAGR